MKRTLYWLLLGSTMWLPSTIYGQGGISLDVENVCRFRDFDQKDGPKIEVAGDFDGYEWFQVSTKGLTIRDNLPEANATNPLPSLRGKRVLEGDVIPAEVTNGQADLLVRMTKDDTTSYRYFHVVKNPIPQIVADPEDGIHRGDAIILKTTEKYKNTTWTYLGVPQKQIVKRASSNIKISSQNTACTQFGEAEWGYIRDKNRDRFHDYVAVTENGGVHRYEDCESEKRKSDLSPAPYSWVDETVRRTRIAPRALDTLKDGSALDRPIFAAVYKVEVVDANGCKGRAAKKVRVDQHLFEFQVGIDYSRATRDGEQLDGTSSESLFADPEGFFGVRTQQYVRRFLMIYGDVRFGGTNIQAEDGQTAPLEEARAFRGAFGLQYEWICGLSTQVCFYSTLEYGFIFPEERKGNDTRLPDDYLNTSFYGIGYRYHNPSSKFHGSFAEAGLGRSDNFDDSSDRFKARAEVLFNLGQAWNFRLRGELDADRGSGPDDLRVLIGASRDLSFLGDIFTKLLGLGEKKKED